MTSLRVDSTMKEEGELSDEEDISESRRNIDRGDRHIHRERRSPPPWARGGPRARPPDDYDFRFRKYPPRNIDQGFWAPPVDFRPHPSVLRPPPPGPFYPPFDSPRAHRNHPDFVRDHPRFGHYRDNNVTPTQSWRKRFKPNYHKDHDDPNRRFDEQDEGNYEDLLEKYKSIQKQLENLEEEEDGENQVEEENKETDVKKNGAKENQSAGEKLDSEKPAGRPCDVIIIESSPEKAVVKQDDMNKEKEKTKDDEEELDLEELRKIALASAKPAKKTEPSQEVKTSPSKKTTPPKNMTKKISPKSNSVKKISHPKSSPGDRVTRSQNSRTQEPPRRSSTTKSADRSDRRRSSSGKESYSSRPPKKTVRSHSDDRLKPQAKKDGALESSIHELKTILSLKDSDEKIARILQLIGNQAKVNRERQKVTGKSKSFGPKGGQKKSDDILQDNYEEVEMDIDSNEETAMANMEEFNMEDPDFHNAMQPVTMEVQDPMIQPFYGQSFLQPWVFPQADLTVPYMVTQVVPPPPPPINGPHPPPPLPSDPPPPVPPPPEAPPLPDGPPPDDSAKPPSPPVDTAEEEGDEAALLRAQLLKSMAMKKKQSTQESQPPVKPVSNEASPVTSRSQSPAPQVLSVHKQNKQSLKRSAPSIYTPLPVHKPVVIPLENSSDEEDIQSPVKMSSMSALLGNLDSFLKAARKSVEESGGKVKLEEEESKMQHMMKIQQIQQYEASLTKQRQAIIKDQEHLKMLIKRASNYLRSSKLAEKKVEQLREQLTAAEKVVAANKSQLEKTKSQAKGVKDRLLEKKKKFKDSEEAAVNLGKDVYGPHYKPRIVTVEAQEKKEGGLSVTVFNEMSIKTKTQGAAKENAPPRKIVTKKSADFIAREKERLKKLEKEYAEKIRKLKEAQGISIAPKPNEPKPRIPKKSEKKSLNETLENIKLEPVDIADDSESKPRRRSLIEINPSNKPNIPTTEAENETNKKENKTKDDQKPFNMPTGLQLANLKKLQTEKMDRILQIQKSTTSSWCRRAGEYTSLMAQLKEMPGLKMTKRGPHRVTVDKKCADVAYKSPLLSFRAYRFSPYFRTKSNKMISSGTFSNKLDARRILCRYDLLGRCNDEKCTGQHERDFKMSEREVLMDLAAYWPKLAGVKNANSQDCAKSIGSYIDNLIRQHEGQMTSDQLCLLLASKVTEEAGKNRPYSMFYERRQWRPLRDLPDKQESESNFRNSGSKSLSFANTSTLRDKDNVLCDEDVRYYAGNSTEIQSMESLVMENPNDVQLWLKLAHRKLYSDNTSEANLDQALNVLARGLEANKDSSVLWYRYLSLYQYHPDATDLPQLCQTAIKYAPSYQIWQLYAEIGTSFQSRDSICDRTLEFLASSTDVDSSRLSHQILETLLYKVTLVVQSGRYKTGLTYLQNLLKKSDHNHLLSPLSLPDRCVLWLSYIHLLEFHQLPQQLFDPLNQNPGRILSKTDLLIPWESKEELITSVSQLVSNFWEAVESCGGVKSDECLPLLQNLVRLLKSQARWEEACSTCRQILASNPDLVDIWLATADLYSTCKEVEGARRVLNEAVSAHPFSAKLHFFMAIFEMSKGSGDQALEMLEQFVIRNFDVDTSDPKACDPNKLFCALLGLPAPIKGNPPRLRDGLHRQDIEKDKLYYWLTYSVLLELQGDNRECVEVFETALSSSYTAHDLKTIWTCYLEHHHRELAGSSAGDRRLKEMFELMMRSVQTIPTKFPIPNSEEGTWRDFSHVNQMVHSFLAMMTRDERVLALEKLVETMPANVELVVRCMEEVVSGEEYQRSRSLYSTLIWEGMANVQLWKMILSLAQKQGSAREVEKLYVKAVRALPMSITLWKDFLLFEITEGRKEMVQEILNYTTNLGLNIGGFVATIS